MVDFYLAERLALECAAEVERKAQRYAALHPISEDWYASDDPSWHRSAPPVVTGPPSQLTTADQQREPRSNFRWVEAWRRRRACRGRRQHPALPSHERVGRGRE